MPILQAGNKKQTNFNQGFSLIEILIVITLLSIFAVVITPRISNVLDSSRKNITLVSLMLVKCFDDSFINNRTNFFAIHLNSPGSVDIEDINREILERSNGISVVTLDESGLLSETTNRLLKAREFSSSFSIDKVLLSGGREFESGTVLLPFFPEGYSSDAIIHVTVDQVDRYSIVISKLMKHPYIQEDHIDFESMWKTGF